MAGLKCRLLSGHYLAYIDNELPERLRRKVEAHLQECEVCRQEIARLTAEAELADKIAPAAAPEDFTHRVMARLESTRARRPAAQTNRPLSLSGVGWAAAALALLVLVLGYFARQPQRVAPDGGAPAPVVATTPEPEGGQEVAQAPTDGGIEATMADDGQEAAVAATEETEEITASEEALEYAVYYEENGEFEAALEEYEYAAQDPENRDAALFAMGRVYEKMGLTIAAMEAFEEALAYSDEYYDDEWERSTEG